MSTSPPTPEPAADFKAMARRLRTALADDGVAVTHSRALELVARQHGLRDWNTLVAQHRAGPAVQPVPTDPLDAVPILRIFDAAVAFDFYCGYLAFQLDWQHRGADHEPLYAQVSRGAVRLHLSEHYGDGSPGAGVLLTTPDVRALHRELRRRPSRINPGVEEVPWGLVLVVLDPFHNRLTFHQPRADLGADRSPVAAAPIRHDLEVACDVATAFDVFTSRLGEWWDPAYSPDAAAFAGAEVEPRVGGAVTMVLTGLPPYRFGTVTAWEPGSLYAQTFTLAQDPDHPSELRVTFTPRSGGCQVGFEHGGWTAGNAARRDHFTDWPKLLGRFADLADSAGRAAARAPGTPGALTSAAVLRGARGGSRRRTP
jgi:hypothetical protein